MRSFVYDNVQMQFSVLHDWQREHNRNYKTRISLHTMKCVCLLIFLDLAVHLLICPILTNRCHRFSSGCHGLQSFQTTSAWFAVPPSATLRQWHWTDSKGPIPMVDVANQWYGLHMPTNLWATLVAARFPQEDQTLWWLRWFQHWVWMSAPSWAKQILVEMRLTHFSHFWLVSFCVGDVHFVHVQCYSAMVPAHSLS